MDKAVIFDWSGTLSDNFHLFSKVVSLMFKELGHAPISDDDIKKSFAIPYMKFWNKFLPNLSKEMQNELYEKYIHQVGDPHLFPGIKEAVLSLHSLGYKLFVVSSDPKSKLSAETKNSGLLNVFLEVCAGAHDKHEAILFLVQKYSLDKENTYYVGDSSGDIDEGKLANVKTIGVSWGFQHKSIIENSNPDFLLDSPSDLIKTLK